jgi:hypothetical protein
MCVPTSWRLCRVRLTEEASAGQNRALALPDHGHNRTRTEEVGQTLEERLITGTWTGKEKGDQTMSDSDATASPSARRRTGKVAPSCVIADSKPVDVECSAGGVLDCHTFQ